MKLPDFTLGIEEEFMVIDPETGELKSHISEMITQQEQALPEKVHRELHQSVVEIGSKICADIKEARHEVTHTRSIICAIARKHGLRIGAAGTHPTTHWDQVATNENPRYDRILDDLRVVARANVVYGLHVHVGIEDKELLIDVQNQARYFLPHLLALTTSSPFFRK